MSLSSTSEVPPGGTQETGEEIHTHTHTPRQMTHAHTHTQINLQGWPPEQLSTPSVLLNVPKVHVHSGREAPEVLLTFSRWFFFYSGVSQLDEEGGGGASGSHSRLTPCFSSLCRALLGSEKALSWWLGMPEFLREPLCCWKKVSWARLRVPYTAAPALLRRDGEKQTEEEDEGEGEGPLVSSAFPGSVYRQRSSEHTGAICEEDPAGTGL